MLRPLHTDTYTVYVTRQGAAEWVKMYIDNNLLIDEWSSLGGGAASELKATISFAKAEGHMYEILVEYRAGLTGDRGLDLQWSTTGGSRLAPFLCKAQHLDAFLIRIGGLLVLHRVAEHFQKPLRRAAQRFCFLVLCFHRL